jgi:prepilin-type N-terminal cleavage/methylation domain-containing protein
MKNRQGFTLIEVVASAVIIGIVFSGVSVLRTSQIEYARNLQADQDILNIQEALSCYLFFHADEPESLKDISIETLFRKGFLTGENLSPWETPYKLIVQDSSLAVEIEPSSQNKRRR